MVEGGKDWGESEWRRKNLINLITTTVTIRPTAKGRLRADDLVTVLRRGRVRRRLMGGGGDERASY